MTQALVFLAMHVVGIAVAFAFGPRRYPALCCALGFMVGIAVAVLVAFVLLILGIYRVWSGSIALGLVTAVAVRVMLGHKDELGRRSLYLAAGWTVGFAAIAALLSYVNLSIMASDSHIIVMLGGVLGREGTFDPRTLGELQAWGAFVVIAHTFGMFTLQDYLYSFQPVMGVSFLAVFALGLWHASGHMSRSPHDSRQRATAVALITAALVTCYVFASHFFFIHQNLGTAIYLLGFVLLYWLADVTGDTSSLRLAFLCLWALAIHRTETPILAIIALVSTVLSTDVPRRAITPLLTAFTLFIVGWYGYLVPNLPEDGIFLTHRRALFAIAPVAAFYVWWLALGTNVRLIRAINRHAHVAVVVLALLALATALATKPAHMLAAWTSIATNLWGVPDWWGYAWYFIAALALIGHFTPPPPRRRAFTLTIGLTIAFIMTVVYERVPYRVALLDSANRMMVHLCPLIFFYLGLKAIAALATTPQPARQPRNDAVPLP